MFQGVAIVTTSTNGADGKYYEYQRKNQKRKKPE